MCSIRMYVHTLHHTESTIPQVGNNREMYTIWIRDLDKRNCFGIWSVTSVAYNNRSVIHSQFVSQSVAYNNRSVIHSQFVSQSVAYNNRSVIRSQFAYLQPITLLHYDNFILEFAVLSFQ